MLMLLLFVLAAAAILGSGVVVLLWARDRLQTDRLPGKWQQATNSGRGMELAEAGPTKITVLFDWLVGDGKYIGDAGVSYLIETSGKKILFDLGDRYGRRSPEPVLHNLNQAGYDPQGLADELSAVVISHHHRDHVGGLKAQLHKTYRLPGDMAPTCPVYLSKPLRHPQAKGHVPKAPEQILPGVAVTGPLPGWMFLLGDTPEQMLIVNLPEGLLLVVGCGHPGVVAMARYAQTITGRPLYAVFGGVHALLDQSKPFAQRFFGAKNPPWHPVTPEDVGILAVGLSDLGVKKIYLSTHDSDDWAVSVIESVFEKDLMLLRVGETYTV